ncbi:hypothetical protein ACSYDW_07275 [Paeniglutamicibacter sp. R2-26]|uniref:hypothetical protein n=1 Tax=Paeniglutamicibacter sp. R2-26 TaxID=3144417 RepID=UPI003EE70C86
MAKTKSTGMTLMKVAGWIFGGFLALFVILAMAGSGLQGWHIVMLMVLVAPVCVILAIIGLVLHLNRPKTPTTTEQLQS